MLIPDIVKILTDSGIEQNEANIEIRLLIEHFTGFSPVDIILGKKLDEEKLKIVEEKAKYRASTKKPIQYIRGLADFMGEKFSVNPSVLIPRDETEILVRKAVEIINQNKFKQALEIGTGSGCIACMVAKLTSCQIIGTDISTEAIHTAFSNMEKMELFNKATFRKSDIYSKIRPEENFDIIISNPPYIPPQLKKTIQTEVTFEPDSALYTKDEKGLEFYEKIIKDAPKFLNPKGFILFELGLGQSSDVAQLLDNHGFKNIQVVKDLANIDRVIFGQLN